METTAPDSLWKNLLDILKDQDTFTLWQHIHGGTTHFPVALLFVAVLFDLGSSVFKQPTWRHVGFWCVLVGAASAVVACLSGLAGGNGWFGVEWSGREMTEGVPNVRSLVNHRQVALVASAIVLLLAVWRGVRRDRLDRLEWTAFIVAEVCAVVGVLLAGLLGAYVSRGM